MKSKLIFCSLLTFSLIVSSCKKEEEAEVTTTSLAPKEIIVPRVAPIGVETYTPTNQPVNMPVTTTPQVVAQNPVVVKAGMNPAHGQPGHRCDIAVGAPLNSPVAAASKTVMPGQASITKTTITPNQTAQANGTPALLKTDAVTAPGMNPPHGQEGHRCDVAVGAALPK